MAEQSKALNWEHIQQTYHNEWLLLGDVQVERKADCDCVTKATVLAHDLDFHKILSLHSQEQYAGCETVCVHSGWDAPNITKRPRPSY